MPWFTLKYAESAAYSFGDARFEDNFREAQKMLASAEKNVKEFSDEFLPTFYEARGFFLSRTATSPIHFKNAEIYYRKAKNPFATSSAESLKIDPINPAAAVEESKMRKCADAAEKLDGIFSKYGLVENGRMDADLEKEVDLKKTEKLGEDWNAIRINHDILVKNLGEDSFYVDMLRINMCRLFFNYWTEQKGRINKYEAEVEQAAGKVKELNKAIAGASDSLEHSMLQGAKHTQTKAIQDYEALAEQYRTRLDPIERSFYQAFGGEHEFDKFRQRILKQNDKNQPVS
jgi:hypothetical protein